MPFGSTETIRPRTFTAAPGPRAAFLSARAGVPFGAGATVPPPARDWDGVAADNLWARGRVPRFWPPDDSRAARSPPGPAAFATVPSRLEQRWQVVAP
ncbi:MAG: hypothetical protein ABI560_14540, partial [Myxococcales bacterium]